MGKAQRLSDTGAIIVPPFGNGTIAAVATQRRQQASESMAGKGWRLPRQRRKSGIRRNLDEGLRLCYNTSPPAAGLWFMRGVPGKQGPMWNKTL